jgi:carbohydrate-selective porin OprB
LTYRLQWSKWLALQPLWQRVRCPGGDASQPDVSFIGMRLEITL